jgi:SAM-dependent methyltransferase
MGTGSSPVPEDFGRPAVDDIYSEGFYALQQDGSARSAEVVIPLFLHQFPVDSVLDVGCGVGGWLAGFQRRGVTDLLGIDGAHVPRDRLQIDPARFREADLAEPLELERGFDAALCLEVAEHLPAEAGDRLVALLAAAAPVVLFSAAIPFQGGFGHLNEQWPSYWAQRFAARGFLAFDPIRPAIQRDQRVDFWYRQNIVVFCRPDRAPPGLRPASPYDLDRVDLELYCFLKSSFDKGQGG